MPANSRANIKSAAKINPKRSLGCERKADTPSHETAVARSAYISPAFFNDALPCDASNKRRDIAQVFINTAGITPAPDHDALP